MNLEYFRQLLDLGANLIKLQNDLVNLEVKEKPGAGPVSNADLYADAWLKEFLPEVLAGDCFSEEDHPYALKPGASGFWLIDPIDGTKDFIGGGDDYCVCGAYFRDSVVQMSIIYAPKFSEVFWAKRGEGAFRWTPDSNERISSGKRSISSIDQAVVLESKSHPSRRTQEFMQKIGLKNRIPMGSALKFCRIAEGKGDLNFRFTPSWDWDVAPGHLILQESGGEILPLNKEDKILYCSDERKVAPFVAASSSARKSLNDAMANL